MKSILFGITWASAQNSILLPVLCGAGVLIGWSFYKRKRAVALLSNLQWRSLLLPHFSQKRQILKALCLGIGCSMLFLAFLQPQWDKKEEPVAQEGRDLFIALDISKSMLAQDVEPSRLQLAKAKIKTLLQLLPSERVGLLLFAGSPVMQCPLTTDHGAFLMFLDQVDHATMSAGTTALDKALQKVLDVFKDVPQKKNKLLVIFTDGEDFSSNLAAIKDQAQEVGLRIITVGIGTDQGAPIPLLDDNGNKTGYQLDDNGSVVISRLNEGILSSLASNLQGFYIHATHDPTDLKKLVSYVECMEKEKFDDKKIQSLQEQYHYFVAVAFFSFMLEWLI